MCQTVCKKCVIGIEDDSNIVFDENGVCNHCNTYNLVLKKHENFLNNRDEELNRILKEIKKNKKGKYDCVIGLSGGTDSSYLAYLVKEWGLNPLAVHFDNGWNSELSVRNIENILNALNIDLYTYVVDWQEFRDLQRSYIEASVVDIEALSDHAISAILYKVACNYNIKYILSGASTFTEGYLPNNWVHNKSDVLNIKDIHKKFGKIKMKTFPLMDMFDRFYYAKIKGIQCLNALDYVDYQKEEAQKIIEKKLKWENYGGKHNESLFTKFYQAYILPQKFNIDKRKSHLSTLICAGQMSREDAIEVLKKPVYNLDELRIDKKFVLKKLGYSEQEFEEIMRRHRVEHTSYKSIMHFYSVGVKVKRIIKRVLLMNNN